MSDASAVDSRPKPAIRRGFWIMLAVSLATLTASLFTSGGVLALSSLGGWLLTVVTLLVGGKCILRRADGRRAMRFGLLLAALLLIGQTGVAWRTERVLGHVLAGRHTKLAYIGYALREYANTSGHYPECLTSLVKTNLTYPNELVARLDPGLDRPHSYADWPRDPAYSSYVYQPGKGSWQDDSRLVLAYEYDAWCPTRLRLFPEYARWVLFGDARVELLDSEAFNRALRDDAVRRKELGWPRHMTRPVGGPTTTTTCHATE